ncbi:MAG TPA: transposase, partial [Bryobacteraceae bacterium]
HQLNEHHRWLIQQSIEHIVLLDRQMEQLEDRIMEKIKPYQKQFDLLSTLPGVKDLNAASILAEIGPDMSVFPSDDQLCSWAGRCPGNNRTAGKSKSGRVIKANKFLSSALRQAALGAVRIKDCIMRRKFQRWVKRMGGKKANVAVGRSLLKVAWHVLKNGTPYREPDPGVMHELEKQKLVHHHARRLRALGAEPEAVEAIVQQLLCPDATPGEAAAAVQQVGAAEENRVSAPGKPCRRVGRVPKARGEPSFGKLGFRARPARKRSSLISQPCEKSTMPTGHDRSQQQKGSHGDSA